MKISLLINMKMPTIVGIFIFISRENFTLSWVEHEKSFITSGPDLPANLESLARANKFNSVYAFCYQTANATNNLYWCAGWSRNSLFVFKPGFYIHVRQSNTSWIIKIYNMNWLQHEKKNAIMYANRKAPGWPAHQCSLPRVAFVQRYIL